VVDILENDGRWLNLTWRSETLFSSLKSRSGIMGEGRGKETPWKEKFASSPISLPNKTIYI
jgi:hypothetical protein